jgi:hypothetical protein
VKEKKKRRRGRRLNASGGTFFLSEGNPELNHFLSVLIKSIV